MSNKTQLQANNTKLSSLIAELDNKITGSNSSKETCIVDIASPYDLELQQLIYNDGSNIINYDFSADLYSRINLTVVKPSMLYLNTGTFAGTGFEITSGDAESIGHGLIAIYGNCIIEYADIIG